MIAHPPDRRLYLFFSGRNNNRAPARQTTVSFFSGRNNDRDRKKKVPVVIKFVLVQLELQIR